MSSVDKSHARNSLCQVERLIRHTHANWRKSENITYKTIAGTQIVSYRRQEYNTNTWLNLTRLKRTTLFQHDVQLITWMKQMVIVRNSCLQAVVHFPLQNFIFKVTHNEMVVHDISTVCFTKTIMSALICTSESHIADWCHNVPQSVTHRWLVS